MSQGKKRFSQWVTLPHANERMDNYEVTQREMMIKE
jgi:hypothetical protein